MVMPLIMRSERNTKSMMVGIITIVTPANSPGQSPPVYFIDVISELGRGCTSSAWGCAIGSIHQWLIAGFPEQAQDDVWKRDPGAFACVSYAPTGTTEMETVLGLNERVAPLSNVLVRRAISYGLKKWASRFHRRAAFSSWSAPVQQRAMLNRRGTTPFCCPS